MKKPVLLILSVLLLLAGLVGLAGCAGADIGLDDIHLNFGKDSGTSVTPDKTDEQLRCQLSLDTRVVTVSGSYVYPCAVNFYYRVMGPEHRFISDGQQVLKYTDSKGFVKFTTNVTTLPKNCYVIITATAHEGDEIKLDPGSYSQTSMTYTYAEIKKDTNRRSGDLYTFTKSITVLKGSNTVPK